MFRAVGQTLAALAAVAVFGYAAVDSYIQRREMARMPVEYYCEGSAHEDECLRYVDNEQVRRLAARGDERARWAVDWSDYQRRQLDY